MEIRIHIPRPLALLTVTGVGILFWTGILKVQLPSLGSHDGVGGGSQAATLITDAVRDIDRERVTQAVLDRQEEILRYQLQTLEEAALEDQSPENMRRLGETRSVLLSVMSKRSQSEKLLRLSLEQLWDAEGSSYSLKRLDIDTELDWPVEPRLGISAYFEDASYVKRFGIDHHAIDIPVKQGSFVRAPADGTVVKVAMNGLGYSFIILAHGTELQTIYGHMSEAMVKEGDAVTFGQVIGTSGGQPGTPGAGLLTTGPHLHFAVRAKGVLVDPLQYLPRLEGIETKQE